MLWISFFYFHVRGSRVPLFGNDESGNETECCHERREQKVPACGNLRGEQLGQGSENEAEYDQIGCGGVFLHGALDQVRRQKNTADRADHKRRKGDER